MSKSGDFNFKSIGMLLRVVAVATSSVAAIISTWLPLVFGYTFPFTTLFLLLLLLIAGAFLVRGLLTHIFNDITDFESGTDAHSPALLSGGSRVIQTGAMSLSTLKRLGGILIITLCLSAIILAFFEQYELAVLIIVGIWGALSYSSAPFKFSYKPFIGEWLSLFPSLCMLGLAAPWIMLSAIPLWGWQNAIVNAVWCMAWVMVHHIPDIEADKKAIPVKRTSVVWSVGRFGNKAAPFPALLYLFFISILAVWIMFTRPVAGLGTLVIVLYGLFLIMRMNTQKPEAATDVEKKLLLLAMSTAIWLGIFV